jgi:hypothetical protein
MRTTGLHMRRTFVLRPSLLGAARSQALFEVSIMKLVDER